MSNYLLTRSHKLENVVSSLKKFLVIPKDYKIIQLDDENSNAQKFVISNSKNTNYLAVILSDKDLNKSEDLLKNLLRESNTMSLGLILDNNLRILKIIRKSFRTKDFDYVANLDSVVNSVKGVSISCFQLNLLDENYENILFEVHSALRDIDGLHASEALEEICKIIYAKLYDEESSMKNKIIVFQRNLYSSVEECAAEIRRLYNNAVEDDKAVFVNKIPTYQRSRGVFNSELHLSSSAIVKCVDILQYFNLSHSSIDIKGRAFQKILIPAVRSGMGQYFTPKVVIDFIVGLMKPNVRELIIDPFCGSGHFLSSSIDYVRRSYGESDKIFHEFAFTRLHGIEKSDRMVRIAMTDMRLHGDGHSNIRCTDALLPFTNYPDLHENTFDLIMTNPPFGIDLPPETLYQVGPFELIKNKNNNISFEILALERCIQLLKPEGRLAIVVPDSILGNKNTSYVRNWLGERVVVKAIISLPVETFSPYGTNIKTSVLIVSKVYLPNNQSNERQVFLAEAKNIGYDANGRVKEVSDLEIISQNFQEFIEKEGWL